MEERDVFFSEEKKQKTFISWRKRQDPGHGLDLGTRGKTRVFWFFFCNCPGRG
jgi:hypothetical protein